MRLLTLVFVVACGRPLAIGGTPGPPAIACGGDRACIVVRDALESARGNIGAPCGTTSAEAKADILELGPAAIPYLESALADRDALVARLAAWTLVDLGAANRVMARCASQSRAPACVAARERIDQLGDPRIAGTWKGFRNGEPRRVLTVIVVGDGGTICTAGACVPLDRIEFAGARWKLEYANEAIVLQVDPTLRPIGGAHAAGRVLGPKCPRCQVESVHLWREP